MIVAVKSNLCNCVKKSEFFPGVFTQLHKLRFTATIISSFSNLQSVKHEFHLK